MPTRGEIRAGMGLRESVFATELGGAVAAVTNNLDKTIMAAFHLALVGWLLGSWGGGGSLH